MDNAATLDIPAWVPNAVKIIAHCMGYDQNEIGQRLLTAPNMKRSWKYLSGSGTHVEPESIEQTEAYARLAGHDMEENDHPQRDLACAALFAFAVNMMSRPPLVWTGSSHRATKKSFLDAASLCRAMVFTDHLDTSKPELADALKKSADYLEGFSIRVVTNIENSPFYVKNHNKINPAKDHARVLVNLIGPESKRLFGAHLCGTLANFLNTGLQLAPQITRSEVEDWCQNLP